MIQSRSQSPDKGMSAGMASTSTAALTTGAISGLNATLVKLKITNSEMIVSGMNFAERNRGAVRGIGGNFISNSPCERWSRDHQNLVLNLGTRGISSAF